MFKILLIVSFLVVSCSGNDSNIEIEDSARIPRPASPPPPPVPIPDGDLPAVVNLQILEDQILLDLNTLSDNDRLNARYLVTCNNYNQGERDLGIYESGVNLGINSISTERVLERVAPLGPGGCIYRLDRDSYGITQGEWDAIEKRVLLEFVTESIRGQQIQFLTQTLKPYLFASDFFTTTLGADALTANNGLYYALIEQPININEFFLSIGVDVQGAYDDEEASLSGFSESAIAIGKTRGIQVVEGDISSYLITSFDSALSDQDSHFLNPFTKEAANAQGQNRSDKIFNFAAQEHIYFLENNMLGYRLNAGGNGDAEVVAPNDVVINLLATSQGLDSTIFIGSCGGCHNAANPMLAFSDQLKSHVLSQSAFDADEKELAEVFMDATEMDGRIRTIAAEYSASLQRLGISPQDEDPLGRKLINPFRAEMKAAQIAGYLLMPVNVFLDRLAGSNDSSQVFGNLLSGGSVGLGILSANFEQLVIDVGAYKDVEL